MSRRVRFVLLVAAYCLVSFSLPVCIAECAPSERALVVVDEESGEPLHAFRFRVGDAGWEDVEGHACLPHAVSELELAAELYEPGAFFVESGTERLEIGLLRAACVELPARVGELMRWRFSGESAFRSHVVGEAPFCLPSAERDAEYVFIGGTGRSDCRRWSGLERRLHHRLCGDPNVHSMVEATWRLEGCAASDIGLVVAVEGRRRLDRCSEELTAGLPLIAPAVIDENGTLTLSFFDEPVGPVRLRAPGRIDRFVTKGAACPRFPRAGGFSLTLLDAEGQPAPGRLVRAWHPRVLDELLDMGVTDGGGQLSLDLGEPQRARLAFAEAVVDSPEIALAGESRTVSLAPTCPLAAILLDDQGHPVVDAEVRLGLGWSGAWAEIRELGTAESDASGRLFFPAAPLHTGWLHVVAEGMGVRYEPLGDQHCEEELSLVLDAGVTLTGRVVADESELGIPGASITLTLMNEEYEASTDAHGAFFIAGLPRGVGMLRADHPLHGTARRRVELPQSGEPTLTLAPRARVAGTVGGLPGEALASVALELSDELDRAAHHPAPDGSFAVEGVRPGRVQLGARLPLGEGQRAVLLRRFELAPGQTGEAEFVFGPALEGQILFRGQPLAGARVQLAGDDSDAATQRHTSLIALFATDTDAHGRFVLEGVPAGPYGLEVESAGRRWHRPLRVEPERHTPLEIEMAGEELEGLVYDAQSGVPIRGARIEATRSGTGAVRSGYFELDGEREAVFFGSGSQASATSDADGRFTLELEPGRHRAYVHAKRYVRQQSVPLDTEAREKVEIALEPAAGLHGVAYDTAGHPAAFRSVGVVCPVSSRGTQTLAMTDALGRFSVEGHGFGPCIVTLEGLTGARALEPVTLTQGERYELSLRARPLATMTLLLPEEAGAIGAHRLPLTVVLGRDDSLNLWRALRWDEARVDSDPVRGTSLEVTLPAGDYRVGYGSGRQVVVELRPGELVALDLR